MVGITTHAKTNQLCINFCTTGFGVFVFFQHHHTGAVAQHKTITVFVPRSAGLLWCIITGRECPGSTKTTHT